MTTAEQTAVTYASRTLGPEWETVLKISEALASGKRIPLIENLDDVEEQLRANVSVRDFENSEIFSRVIIQEWKNARGNRSDINRQIQIEKFMAGMMSGNAAAQTGIQDMLSKSVASATEGLQDDEELQKLMDRAADRKQSVESATTEYGKQDAMKEYQAAMDELNVAAEAKMKELQLPQRSFHTAARIIALGRGCVEDAVYDHILSVTLD